MIAFYGSWSAGTTPRPEPSGLYPILSPDSDKVRVGSL